MKNYIQIVLFLLSIVTVSANAQVNELGTLNDQVESLFIQGKYIEALVPAQKSLNLA